MKHGILSDVHGNLEALMTCLSYLKSKVTSYICPGDIVGYGPNPNECIEVLRELKELIAVAGNHDRAAVGLKDTAWFNPDAHMAIVWTGKMLSQENKTYLQNLKNEFKGEKFTVVHGSPRDPIDEYLLYPLDMEKNLSYFDSPLCFIGHSHIPLYYFKKKMGILRDDETLDLEGKAIVNLGSVGQPRDRNPLAAVGIYDDEKGEIKIKRLSYDIRRTQKEMLEAGLPSFLIERLAFGR